MSAPEPPEVGSGVAPVGDRGGAAERTVELSAAEPTIEPVVSELVLTGGRPLRGEVRVPGCKGISHRALLLAAVASGTSRIAGLADGHDVRRTRDAIARLGATVRDDEGGPVTVRGAGFSGLREPEAVVECGNSASTLRMVAGLAAGRPFHVVLTGDESLARRPMRRVVEPLRAMGARIDGRAGGELAPLAIRGGALRGTVHELAVASGQVKTALVLAGLQAEGVTEIREPAPSRDHTERMLGALGAPIETLDDRTLRVRAGEPAPFELTVPGDPSSAAFLVVAATIVPGSAIVVSDVALNPGRLAYVEVLRRMGARIEARRTGVEVGEPRGDLAVEYAPLHGTVIESTEAIVDELPALAVAAAFAEGTTEIRDAAELRVKESDRIATLDQELGQLGIGVETRPDGLVVRGGRPRGAALKSHGDHRIAMAAAVAGLGAEGETRVRGWAAVNVSYPGFERDITQLTRVA